MDDLPSAIVVEILSRVNDSSDLARIICSHDRFARSRAPETRSLTFPFKSVVDNLVSLLRDRQLESLSLGVEEFFTDGNCEFDESDDLHLTATDFVSRWLPGIGRQLRLLSISDLWLQSCWRQSEVLALISDCCEHLLSLEVRKAWLSVEGLKPMPALASLTLEIIRLDDEDLEKINACFPSLEHLNLIGVGGLKQPKIHLPRLKTCRWTASHVPFSIAVHAPLLTDLSLVCVSPRVLSLRTPSLRRLHLKVKQVGLVEADRLLHLNSLTLDSSSGLQSLLRSLAAGDDADNEAEEAPLELEMLPSASLDLAAPSAIPKPVFVPARRRLRRLTLHLRELPISLAASIYSVLLACGHPQSIVILLHGNHPNEEEPSVDSFVSVCANDFPDIKWSWATGTL
ncbi:unnamed protein product [Spirodela intermedia]|uniref:Uncharacterized protein n=1 Tax=Spirodela intermedia TaxID=51605 RepID=A0A7I8ITL0_SPIIN|nr:unnamed protein product [Spirodela intermedia]CAA6660948.1 unnamed protein product [Spirodela intermedia]